MSGNPVGDPLLPSTGTRQEALLLSSREATLPPSKKKPQRRRGLEAGQTCFGGCHSTMSVPTGARRLMCVPLLGRPCQRRAECDAAHSNTRLRAFHGGWAGGRQHVSRCSKCKSICGSAALKRECSAPSEYPKPTTRSMTRRIRRVELMHSRHSRDYQATASSLASARARAGPPFSPAFLPLLYRALYPLSMEPARDGAVDCCAAPRRPSSLDSSPRSATHPRVFWSPNNSETAGGACEVRELNVPATVT